MTQNQHLLAVDSDEHLLEVDSRRRVSLSAFARHRYYLVSVDADGVITLTPAAVMTAAQAEWLDEFLSHPETGAQREPPAR